VNLLLVETPEPTVRLAADDPRLEHVRGVLRAQRGDTICLGAVNGPRGEGVVHQIDADGLTLDVSWGATPTPPPALDLLIGLPRPATAKKVLVEAATLGAHALHFVTSAKSDPAYARSNLWQESGWRPSLHQGAEQAFTTHIPAVSPPSDWTTVLKKLPAHTPRLALDVYEGEACLSAALPDKPPAILAIGPERGWNQHDRNILRENGFRLVSLGERVLRVESAVTVALALTLGTWGLL